MVGMHKNNHKGAPSSQSRAFLAHRIGMAQCQSVLSREDLVVPKKKQQNLFYGYPIIPTICTAMNGGRVELTGHRHHGPEGYGGAISAEAL